MSASVPPEAPDPRRSASAHGQRSLAEGSMTDNRRFPGSRQSSFRPFKAAERDSRIREVTIPVLASARYERDGRLPPLTFSKSPTAPQSTYRKPETDDSSSGVVLPLLPVAGARSSDNAGVQGTPTDGATGYGARFRPLGSESPTGQDHAKYMAGLGAACGASPAAGAVLWPEANHEATRGRGSAIQQLQDEIERFRVANEELKRAVNNERETYGATVRDIKLLCLTQDEADVAKTQVRLRQYYGLRQMLVEKSASQSTVTEADRLVLDQITTLNAELELALAERQAERHRHAARGGQLARNGSAKDTWAKCISAESQLQDSLPGRLRDELLQTITSLQQENQRLHEENVRVRRTLAAFAKKGSSADTSGSFGSSTVPPRLSVPQPERPTTVTKTEETGSVSRQQRGPRGGVAVSRWSKLLRGGESGDWTLSENRVRHFLEMEGALSPGSLTHVDLARGMVGLYHSLLEKMRYYRRRSRVLQANLAAQQRRAYEGGRGKCSESEVGEEAFSMEWKVGTLEAEISRLRRLLELSTGTSLSLATIHSFFLDQRTILQRQLEGEEADITALEDQWGMMKEMRQACGAEGEDTSGTGPGSLNDLVGEGNDTGHGTRQPKRLPSKTDAIEGAFLAACDGVAEAVDTLKTRHAQTEARLAQIQVGLTSVTQDLKILDREQRTQMEKHMKDLNEASGGDEWPMGQLWKPCYIRQFMGPPSTDREAQTDNVGIASRRHLYSGEFAVSDSTTSPVTVSIINEEDIVVKLMLEDMEFPPCLYTAVAAIKFPEGSRTGENALPASEKSGAAAKDKGKQNVDREARRTMMKRRRLTDETDGRLIAEMLEVEYVRGTPCLILRGQEEAVAGSQDPHPHASYQEDCLYNDKLSFGVVLPVYGAPLMLLMMQCAKRRFGMLFFHLCAYNSLTGWVKYSSHPSKDICRRFGYQGDRQLLESLGAIKKRGKVAEAAITSQIMKLFEESFTSDAKAAAALQPALITAKPLEPDVVVLCGSLTLGEKTEIVKEQQIQAVKQRQASRRSKRLEFQTSHLSAMPLSNSSSATTLRTETLSAEGSFADEGKPEACSFLYLKICIDCDCYVAVYCDFEPQ